MLVERKVVPYTEHPEDHCNRCGGPNVSWVAPSPLWNAVMRGGCIDGPQEFSEIICPTCFFVLAVERGIAYEFQVDGHSLVPLQTITPSGRIWDSSTRLWEEVETSDYVILFDAGGYAWLGGTVNGLTLETSPWAGPRRLKKAKKFAARNGLTITEVKDVRGPKTPSN